MKATEEPKASARGVRFAQDRSKETLRRILSAAEEVFSERGYDKATVAEIISRAGIGHGTFWLYFRNKEELLSFMVKDMIAEFETFPWYGEDNPEAFPVRTLPQIEEIIRGVMDVFARYAKIHPLIVRASLDSDEFRTMLEEFNQPFLSILERKLIEHLQKEYCYDLDPKVTAAIIMTMLEYINLQLLTKSLPGGRDALIHNLSVIIYHTLNHASA